MIYYALYLNGYMSLLHRVHTWINQVDFPGSNPPVQHIHLISDCLSFFKQKDAGTFGFCLASLLYKV